MKKPPHEVHHKDKEIRARERLAPVPARRTTACSLLRGVTRTREPSKKVLAASRVWTRHLAGRGRATHPHGRPRFPMDDGSRRS
jgi:hypothetical protein